MIILGVDPGLSLAEVAERAYFAGLIDGEGYVGIKRRLPSAANKMTSPKYTVAISLSMTDREVVERFASFAEASAVYVRRRKAHYKTIYMAEIENDRAVAVLEKILPFVIVKKRQAELALALHDLRSQARSYRTKHVSSSIIKDGPAKGTVYRSFGYTDEFNDMRDSLYRESLLHATRAGNGARFL